MECRRSLIGTLVFVSVLASAAIVQAKPKYIIIMIGDGMGYEQVEAGRMYLDQNDQGLQLSFQTLPHQGQVTTYSASSSVTDSAAAATSTATGVKVNNGVISIERPGDSSELETLLEYYQLRLRASGLVTTAYVTHATPAAFGAHEVSRDRYSQIADDYLTQTRPNVILGGNSYMGGAAAAGYSIVTDAAGLLSLANQLDQSGAVDVHVNGQFGSGYMPYEYDGLGALPHLADMTADALAILDNDDEGFFLMVEGARVDHACHSNDLRRATLEVVEFHNAVQVAIDWINAVSGRETETLLLVTSDHETGGLTLDGGRDGDGYPTGSFSSTGHTGADVPVYGWGVNAHMIQPVMDNTDFFAVAIAGNVAPEATEQTVGVMQDDSVVITLEGTDADHDPLTFSVTLLPANGTLDQTNLPDVIYTPDPGYFGPDDFEYVANDGEVNSLAVTVTINVTPPNFPPVAIDDSAQTDEEVAVTIDVLANDSDVEDGVPAVDSATDPANGTVVIDPDDTVTYTPDVDFEGSDSFTYTVRDSAGATATANVVVTVLPINDAPLAVDVTVTTVDTSVVVDVLANDTDVDGDTLAVDSVSDPTNGTAVIEPDDTVTYTPDPAYVGGDTFTYTVSDGNGGTDTATVNVTVAVPNNPPVAVDDGPVPTAEDVAVNIAVIANDSDPDSDPLDVISVTDPANGTAVIELDETITYTPDLNFNGADSFDYTISDGRGGTDTATVTVDIQAVNDAPLALDDGPVVTQEDMAVNIDVLANDGDPDVGDTLTVTTVSDPANGTTVIELDDTVTYTPDPGFTGLDTFTYDASDGQGGTDTATVTVDVQGLVPPYVDDLPLDEVLVEGVLTGTLFDIQTSDNVYESIAEVSSGNKKFTWASLEHTWTFDVTGGDVVTFHVEAWREGTGTDGFTFAYSTDGANFTDMVTVTGAADDNTDQTFALLSQLSGTVYVRVSDTDTSKTELDIDTIYVDQIFIRSSQPTPKASSPNPANGAIDVSVSVTLSWVAGVGAVNHDVYLGTSPTPDYQGRQTGTTYTPAGLAANTTYYWRIDEVDSVGAVTTGDVWSFTTSAACVPTTLHVASIVYDTVSGPRGTKFGRATVTVEDNCGNPVAGAEVSGHFVIDGSIDDYVPSDVTDGAGVVVFLTTEAHRKPTFEFVVDDIIHATLGFSVTSGNAQAPTYGEE